MQNCNIRYYYDSFELKSNCNYTPFSEIKYLIKGHVIIILNK